MSAEGHGRVLVVDDNPATLYSTSRVLRSADFEVTEAATGKEALDLAAKGTDIVMLDVNLPDIHGFEVCQRLRKDPRTARLPIIHVSATFVTDIDKVQGLDAGSDGYLTHPVEPPVLIATVNAFLRARKAEQELHDSEGKFRAGFENALSGILILDHNFNLSRPKIRTYPGRSLPNSASAKPGAGVFPCCVPTVPRFISSGTSPPIQILRW